MDSGYYAACTALLARTEALETVANNLANTNTTGYRAQHNLFRSVLTAVNGSSSAVNQAMNDYGVLGGTRLDLTQGALEHTGNDLDLGIEGPGFFVVQTPTGRVFSRSGNLQVSAQGQLITAQGDPILGENGVIPVVGGPMSISSDGTISVNGALAGKIKLVEFPPGVELKTLGGTYYTATRSSEIDATRSQIRQGMLEASNVNPVASMVELITVQRSAEMMQKALSMFHGDMDRIAAQELPRLNG
jgi:flagellar basal-body rod protein FlgF